MLSFSRDITFIVLLEHPGIDLLHTPRYTNASHMHRAEKNTKCTKRSGTSNDNLYSPKIHNW